MRRTARFEKKYLLSYGQYLAVRNEVRAHMDQDVYSRRRGGRYLVRSLYYDTPNLAACRERINGNFGRIKLRLRVYEDRPDCSPTVSVELKTKKGNSMEKWSCLVPYAAYRYFLARGSWADLAGEDTGTVTVPVTSPLGEEDLAVLREFERLLRVRALRPVVLVQYHREAYLPKDRSGLRLTLDHNVHSSRASELFPNRLLLKPHRPRTIVLEIKNRRGQEPDWLLSLVRRHHLKPQANSKYVQGIEIIRPQMVTPVLEGHIHVAEAGHDS